MRASTFGLLLLLVLVACDKKSAPARCYTEVDCGAGEVCVVLPSSAHLCLETCDLATTTSCSDGSACASVSAADAQAAVCLPGGAVTLGAVCVTSSECVHGAVCVARNGAPASTCELLCTVSGTTNPCAVDQACVAIDAASSSTRGTCVTP